MLAFPERDEVFVHLNHQATQARAAGRIGDAIELLLEDKVRQGETYKELRPALYLQAASQADEALTEIHWLVDRAELQAARRSPSLPAETHLFSSTLRLARIHGKARLICKRMGRQELAAEHAQLHDRLDRQRPKLSQASDCAGKLGTIRQTHRPATASG